MNSEAVLQAVNNPDLAKLPPSNRIVQAFLDGRPESEAKKNVEGTERKHLMEVVFRYLKPKQQVKFAADRGGNFPRSYNDWFTNTLRQRRGITIQANKTVRTFDENEEGAANVYSKENQKLKNKQPNIKASKKRYEKKHPDRHKKFRETKRKLQNNKILKGQTKLMDFANIALNHHVSL